MTREEKINRVLLCVVVGFAAACLYHGYMGSTGKGYPYNTFLFRPDDQFGDFWAVWKRAGVPHRAQDEYHIYPPLSYVLMSLVRGYERMSVLLAFLTLSLSGFLVVNWHTLRGGPPLATLLRVVLLTCCSYPFLIALDRANIEILAFFAASGWLYCYRTQRPALALGFLALAVNLKPFTLALGLMYVARGKWKQLLACATLVASLFAVTLWLTPGPMNQNLRHLYSNLQLYNRFFAELGDGMTMGHSLFGFLKIASATGMSGGPLSLDATTLMRPYLAFVLLAAGNLTLLLARVRLQLWAQLMLSVGAMNLLPYVSADYKLLYLMLPLSAWISTTKASSSRQRDAVTAYLFALLLVPKNFGHLWGDELSLGSVFNPLLMLALCAVAITSREVESSPSPQVLEPRATFT